MQGWHVEFEVAPAAAEKVPNPQGEQFAAPVEPSKRPGRDKGE